MSSKIIIILISLIKQSLLKTPIFVFSFFENGLTSPNNLNEKMKDIFNQKWENKNKLTSIGRRMQYILGYNNYKKYIENNSFLSLKFNPFEIYVLSKNNNNNIESVECHLQGFYPLNNLFSEKIYLNQQKKSNPPINISKSLNLEIKKLNNLNSPLPEFINIIPYHIFYNFDYENKFIECNEKINKIKEKNLENNNIKNLVFEFNLYYKNNFNKLLKEKGEYSFIYIIKICDNFIIDLNYGIDLSFIEKYGINKNNFSNFCEKVNNIKYNDYYFGDEKNEINKVEISPLFNEILIYLKNKINNLENENLKKFILFSGDEFTISGIEIFINKVFNNNIFINPIFASNIYFEVYKKENNNSLNYENYEVKYIINDKLINTFNLNEFIENIENNIWKEEEIFNFCEIKIKKIEFDSYSKLKNIIWILIIIILLLTISIIVLYVKIKKRKPDRLTKLIHEE
jgi:hypothetical protein